MKFGLALQDQWEVLVERGHVSVQQLLEKQEQAGGRKLRLTLDPAARCGPPQVSPLIADALPPTLPSSPHSPQPLNSMAVIAAQRIPPIHLSCKQN